MKKTFLSTAEVCLLIALALLTGQAHQLVAPADVHYSWTTNYATGNSPSAVSLANIRGQKTWRDLVVANKNDNTVSVRLCRDAGNFNSSAASYPVDLQPVAVIAADLNRDNYDDVVSANFGTNTISLLPNLKNNTLGAATNHVVGTTLNPGPVALAVGDANGSGRQSVFVANLIENSVTILTNAGNCVLLNNGTVSVDPGPTAIAFADFNNDGAGDIITANTNGTLTILQGNGVGGFTSNATITVFPGGDPQPSAIGVGDFNRDGRIDLVIANYNSNSITILTNSGGSTFLVSGSYDVGTNPRALTIRTLNSDGYLDIAVANENSANVHVFLRNGDGTFSLSTVTGVDANPVGIAAGNFNSDGMSDLAVVGYGNNTASILLYDMPLVANDTILAFEDSPKSITLFGQQVTNAPLTYSILASPVHGALTGTGASYTYTADSNYFGLDSFTYSANDGLNASATGTNTINVLSVNDAPSFTFATNLISAQKFATLTYPNFIASSNVGAANEAGQKITYSTKLLSQSNLFLARPTISPSGTLTFKPSTNNFGTSVVTIVAIDNGGKAYGGTNQSLPQTFTIENTGTNPFPALKGTYNGLFSDPDGISSESAGAFTFTLSSVGAFSGTVTMKGIRYGFAGQFDKSGSAQCSINKAALTCALDLQLDVLNGTEQVTGTISTDSWTADLLGDRLTFGASNPSAQAGKYTLNIPGTTGSTHYPNGDSYGTFTISTNGKVSFTGVLADGVAVNQTSYLSKNGVFPFYAPLYSGLGILSGWITVDSGVTGSLSWSSGSYYGNGWNTNVTITGSAYTTPPTGTRIVDLPSVLITLRDGNLPTPLTTSATLSTGNTFTYSANTNRIALFLSTGTGAVSGSFRHPVTLQTITLRGAVFQQQQTIEGFFNASGVSGHFEISAP